MGGCATWDSHDHGRRMEAQGQLTVTALPNSFIDKAHQKIMNIYCQRTGYDEIKKRVEID